MDDRSSLLRANLLNYGCPPQISLNTVVTFLFTVLKVGGAGILKHNVFFMDLGIYIYVEKYKIIDQKNT